MPIKNSSSVAITLTGPLYGKDVIAFAEKLKERKAEDDVLNVHTVKGTQGYFERECFTTTVTHTKSDDDKPESSESGWLADR